MITQALTGIRVVEVTTYIPGPICGRMLAAMGASVTKIERPGGDPMRSLPPLGPDGISPMYAPLNAGKTVIELDLKAPADTERLGELLTGADILIDGLRPGALERMGFGSDHLHAVNPGLIICTISAFGLQGPDAARAGHDLNLAALSGLLAMTTVDGTPAMPGAQLADMISGMTATAAILAALQSRSRDGGGALLDASMASAARWLMAPWYAVARAGVALPADRPHELNGVQACYRIYRTADNRHLAVAALEPHFWARFCHAIDRPDLIADHLNPAAQPALIDAVQQAITQYDLAHWTTIFNEVEACISPILHMEEAAPDTTVDLRLPVRQL
ncbi:MAG: CoA transferase [Oscillochloris sp.]|nr:CoA transferase [Oscillochloris sp.]